MDIFPLINSIRISLISTVIVLVIGIISAYYVSKTPSVIKGSFDVVFTLPLVLPPTVVGFLLLQLVGPNHFLGKLFLDLFDIRLTMNWYSAIFATAIVAFPLMYRTARSSFDSYDKTLTYAGKTLGLSDTYIFWRVVLPNCKQGIIAGLVLSFARALGEYGATSMVCGYTPGKTATISTTVYQLWRTNNEALAAKWVAVNILISAFVLIFVNIVDSKNKKKASRRVLDGSLS